MTKRRRFTPAFKKTVVLAVLRGDRTIQDIAAHYEVHPNMISTWKRQAIEGMEDIFDSKNTGRQRDIDGEIKVLHAKIGELIVINDFLEKGLKG